MTLQAGACLTPHREDFALDDLPDRRVGEPEADGIVQIIETVRDGTDYLVGNACQGSQSIASWKSRSSDGTKL